MKAPHGPGSVVRADESSLLSAPEVDTARRFEAANPGIRLYDYEARTGQQDYDYYDADGRIYDQMGDPATSEHWNGGGRFLASIDKHIGKLKSLPVDQRGGIMVDVSGFTEEQKRQVRAYINRMPSADQALLIRAGF